VRGGSVRPDEVAGVSYVGTGGGARGSTSAPHATWFAAFMAHRHERVGDPRLADGILDRLVHGAEDSLLSTNRKCRKDLGEKVGVTSSERENRTVRDVGFRGESLHLFPESVSTPFPLGVI
jgi:hypothetical protein